MMSIFSSSRDLISLGSFPLLTVSPLGPFGTQFGASSSEQFVEILTTGFVHGFFFSLPFSIPMLICFRRYRDTKKKTKKNKNELPKGQQLLSVFF